MEELSYSTVFTVIESWEVLRRKKDFAETMGQGLLVKFLQERPDAMTYFDFEFEFALNDASDHDENDLHDDEKYNNPLYKSQHFIQVGKNFVTFVDQAVDMLGPADLESLTDSFVELGTKNHLTQYNLPSKLYPVMGSALLGQLDEMLGPKDFTIKTRGAWLQLFRAISLDMTPEPPVPEPEEDENPELDEHEKKQKRKSPLFFGRKRLSFERRKSNERRNSNGSRTMERRNSNERRYSNERRRLSNDSGHSISRRRFSNDSGHSAGRRLSNDSGHSTGRRYSNDSGHSTGRRNSNESKTGRRNSNEGKISRRNSNESKTSNGSGSNKVERRYSFGRRFSNEGRATSFRRRFSNDSRG